MPHASIPSAVYYSDRLGRLSGEFLPRVSLSLLLDVVFANFPVALPEPVVSR